MKSGKSKAPEPTTEEVALRARQMEDLSKLDEEENRRIKGILRSQSSGRLFRMGGTTSRRGAGSSTIPRGMLGKEAGGYNIAFNGSGVTPKKK